MVRLVSGDEVGVVGDPAEGVASPVDNVVIMAIETFESPFKGLDGHDHRYTEEGFKGNTANLRLGG
jgi:hypothetical protein